jgi:predicted class III extradiol MEMO1 family dioxygenase
MFIYHRNVSVSIVPIIRKHNNDALTNNIYSFFLKYIQMCDIYIIVSVDN